MSNSIFGSILKRFRLRAKHLDGCIYVRGRFNRADFLSQEFFVVDLSSRKYIHLGDVLFFLPIILFLANRRRVVVIAPEFKFDLLRCFILNLSNISCVCDYDDVPLDMIVVTQPYAIDDVPDGRVVVALGNPVSLPDLHYPFYLLKNLCSFLGEDFQVALKCFPNGVIPPASIANLESQKRLFISPFIASGKFRDLFGFKRRRIIKFAKRKHYEEGFEIFLLGARSEHIKLPFPFVDFRGESFVDLISLIRGNFFAMGVGFDNFWMHVSDIFNVYYLVMFRGRFSRFGRLLHYSSVNVSFCRDSVRNYLTLTGVEEIR